MVGKVSAGAYGKQGIGRGVGTIAIVTSSSRLQQQTASRAAFVPVYGVPVVHACMCVYPTMQTEQLAC